MNLPERIAAFEQLGNFIKRHYSSDRLPSEAALHEGLDQVIVIAESYNNWFLPKFVNEAIQNLGIFLERPTLDAFCKPITNTSSKTVAIICAGNIPLVCFHDLMCVLLTGHKVLIKLSSDDKILPPFFLKMLCHYAPEFEQQVFFSDGKLSAFDAVIATGSDNTASHLHYYFGKYPNIIRKNRSSIAILDGTETSEDLKALGTDIFQYFGLGCRNVTKLMVPAAYNFNLFFESIIDFGYVINNKKYGNNYDYNRAIFLLESIPFLDNNFLMIREQTSLHSAPGVLNYEYYSSADTVPNYLETHKNELQCVIGKDYVPFGYSQRPVITDFADNVNTLDFLVNL